MCPQGESYEAISFKSELFAKQKLQPSHLKAREYTAKEQGLRFAYPAILHVDSPGG